MLDRLWLPIAGFIHLPGNESTAYTFSLESDDGSVLIIDGKKVTADSGASLIAMLTDSRMSWGATARRRTALTASQSASACSAECACIEPAAAHHAVPLRRCAASSKVGFCPLPASEQQVL